MVTSCARCGATPGDEPHDGVPLGWSLHTEGDRVLRLCADCTRQHVRSIEAKLDPEWW
ncbi:MAG: hypothetical protein ACSLFP_14905 [Acidimicrobiales bacterium]